MFRKVVVVGGNGGGVKRCAELLFCMPFKIEGRECPLAAASVWTFMPQAFLGATCQPKLTLCPFLHLLTAFPQPWLPPPAAPTLADIDNNGKMEIIMGTSMVSGDAPLFIPSAAYRAG